MTVPTPSQDRTRGWRILMFAPECYPVGTAESIVTGKLMAAMLDAGWDVETLCYRGATRCYPGEDGISPAVRKACTMIGGTLFSKVENGSENGTARGGAWVWAGRATWAALRRLRARRADFLFSRIMPQYGHMPALAVATITGIPWIANWSDPMPRVIAPAPFGRGPESRIPPFLRAYCLGAVKRATWHTFPSSALREYMCHIFPSLTGKSSVIPHIAYSKLTSASRSRQDAFTVCYAGGFALRDPSTFFRAVRVFLDQSQPAPSFSVKLIGPLEDKVNRIITDLGLGKVVKSTGPLPYGNALEEMARSSIGLIIEANCSHPIFLPSKLADFVQAGLPVLAVTPPRSELAKIMALYGGGVSADCGSWQQILRGLSTLYDAWRKGALEQVYSVARLREEFSESRILQTYDDLLTNLAPHVNSEQRVNRGIVSEMYQGQP